MTVKEQKTQMGQLQRLIDEVDKVARERGAPAVGEFLATVMTGKDPRPVESPLFSLVKKIAFREFVGGESFPTPEEWAAIVGEVLGSGLYERANVDIGLSTRAAERLMEYLHAKMKAIEVNANVDARIEVVPLTGADLDAFKERFEDEF